MSEGFWWTALAIAAASAAAHLFTMLGTRWGDRRASFKALLFSLLLHLALFFGLFAVGPRIDRLVRAPEPQPPIDSEPMVIQEIETAAPEPADAAGDTPVWDRPNETPVSESASERFERLDELPEAVEDNRSVVESFEDVIEPIPSPGELPALAETAPAVIESDSPMITSDVRPLAIEEQTADAREEERPTMARSEPLSTLEPAEAVPTERETIPSLTERPDDEFDPTRQLADLRDADAPAELPATELPDDPLQMQRPTAPLPMPDESIVAADDAEESNDGDGSPSRFQRRPSRPSDFAGSEPEMRRATAGDEADVAGPPAARELARSNIDRLRPTPGDLPSLSRPDAAPLTGRQADVPEVYQLRSLDRRSEIARQHGGTEGSEQAVELSLKWLAANQHPDGYWDADAHGAGQVEVDEQGIRRNNAGKTADSGLTALAVLAFLGAGYTHEDGKYAETVDRALMWLVEHQNEDGFLGHGAAHFEQMYCHGMATYALAEAYGMQTDASDTRLRRPLEKAVLYIAAMQHRDGGWRYIKGQAGDMSMFGWQLMALKSAEIAGISMPGDTRSKMIQFLRERSLGEHGGLAAYRKTDPQIPATPAMTAEALFCKQILGLTRTNPASIEAVSYLLRHTPRRSELNYYYWYYGTLAMFQYGGSAWERWNASLRDLLIAEQIKDGPHAGSWAPRDAWGPYGGRVYSTAVATLSLEVYYRFLPLYRAVERPGETSGQAPTTDLGSAGASVPVP